MGQFDRQVKRASSGRQRRAVSRGRRRLVAGSVCTRKSAVRWASATAGLGQGNREQSLDSAALVRTTLEKQIPLGLVVMLTLRSR